METAAAAPTLDTSDSHCWVVRWPKVTSQAAFLSFWETLLGALQGDRRVCLVYDFRAFDPMQGSKALRRTMGQHVQEHAERLRPHILGEVRLLPDPVARAMATTFDDDTSLPWPIENTRSVETARHWIQQILADAGIDWAPTSLATTS